MRWGIGFALMSLALIALHVVTHTAAVLALLLVSPLLTMATTTFAGLQVGPAVLWSLLLLLVRRARAYPARLPAKSAGPELSVPRDSLAV